MYSELVQVDRMVARKMERWTIALDFLQYSNFVGYDDTWLVDTEGRYRSSKWRPRSVWAHRQRLAPPFNAVTTRRGTQEVRLPDRVANYGERGRVQLRLDEINGEFSSIPWEISMPETGLGRNRNVLRLIRRELGPIFLSLEILDERIKLWQMSRYTRERKRKGDKS